MDFFNSSLAPQKREKDLLGSWFPTLESPFIFGAPMRPFAGCHLVTAIASAGGIGFIGAGYEFENLRQELKQTETIISNHVLPSFPSSVQSSSRLPYGIGALLWKADRNLFFSIVKDFSPCAIWLFAPCDSSQLKLWIDDSQRLLPLSKVFVQVNSVQEAVEAIQLGAQVIVAQGSEAGGHGRADRGGLSVVIPDIISELHKDFPDFVIPVLAAGGISTGRGVAASLSLGSSGSVLGTRYLATPECSAPEGFKSLLVHTQDGSQNTIRSQIFDKVRGTGDWPSQFDGRGIKNSIYKRYEQNIDLSQLINEYKSAQNSNNFDYLTVFAGAGVGLIHSIEPAASITRRMQQEARLVIAGLSEIL